MLVLMQLIKFYKQNQPDAIALLKQDCETVSNEEEALQVLTHYGVESPSKSHVETFFKTCASGRYIAAFNLQDMF